MIATICSNVTKMDKFYAKKDLFYKTKRTCYWKPKFKMNKPVLLVKQELVSLPENVSLLFVL